MSVLHTSPRESCGTASNTEIGWILPTLYVKSRSALNDVTGTNADLLLANYLKYNANLEIRRYSYFYVEKSL